MECANTYPTKWLPAERNIKARECGLESLPAVDFVVIRRLRPLFLRVLVPAETLLDHIGDASRRADKSVEVEVEVGLPVGS